jgi:cation:H+ antiporter
LAIGQENTQMTLAIVFVAIGLILLFFGAEVMIRGAVSLARALNISPHVIGLTVIAFGTSAPELFVSLKAALSGVPGIAIGNVIGSNFANILLMIGTVGVVTPMLCSGRHLRRDSLALLAATAILIAASLNGLISQWQGAGMVVLLIGYLFYCYWAERRSAAANRAAGDEADAHVAGDTGMKPWRSAFSTIAGMFGVVIGARLLVDGAVVIATAAGISETVIGITLVAIGTSLPELATTLIAALKRHGEVALANIIGSNIFNTIGIVGVVAAVQPLPIPAQVLAVEYWIMAAVTLIFVAVTMFLTKIYRPIAVTAFLVYLAIIAAQFWPEISALVA